MYTTLEWLKSTIESKSLLISNKLREIEKLHADIKLLDEEIDKYKADLKKLEA